MFRWAPYVFVRITLFFLVGILWAIYFPDSLNERLAQVLLVLFTVSYCFLWYRKQKGQGGLGLSIFAFSILLLSGYVLVLLRTDARNEQHFIHKNNAIQYYKCIIQSAAQEKENSWKQEARVGEVCIENVWEPVEGKVLLYFSKTAYEQPFAYGDILLIKGSPQQLTPPGNPGEFDYKRFLSFKKIYHQHFLRSKNVHSLGSEPASLFMYYAIQARVWAATQLACVIKGKQEQGIAIALVLGVTDGLDDEILHAYSATGAMHVLAVSGLHVGIIYAILLFFLRPIAKRKGGQWTIVVISLTVLWGYAFITGLSPSVLRAVTMFSFVALAKPFHWSSNIYNTLSLSAFCLLLYEPYLIMSVGFQLSYLAVLGIVYLQRPLYQLWEAPHWLLDNIWQITTVSIAAQLATVSLGLLYFHQFPVYFIFSNLLVIPLSFVVLVLGLAVLVFSAIVPLTAFLGWLLKVFIYLMNASVTLVESLPFSLLDNLYITTDQSWLIMLVLICGVLLIQYKRFYYLVGALVFAAILSTSQWWHFNKSVDKRELIVYKVPGHCAVDFIRTGQAFLLTDSTLLFDEEKTRFHIRPNRLISEIARTEVFPEEKIVKISKGCRLIAWEGRTMLIVEEKDARIPSLKVDFLLISNNATSIAAIQGKINFAQLIVDSNNSFYFADKLVKEATEAQVPFHSVLHQGYFNVRL